MRFEAASELLKEVTEDTTISTQYPIVCQLLSDSHPGVQEKALESLLILIPKCKIENVKEETIGIIIERCMTSIKSTVRTKAGECMFAIVEMGNSQGVIYECIKSRIESKTTSYKVVSACLHLLISLLENYGDAQFPVSEIADKIVSQAGSSNNMVKTSAMEYLREAHRWNSKVIDNEIMVLKESQQEELKR